MDSQLRSRLNELLYHLLLVAILVLAGWLSSRHTVQWDWTANARNTLSDTSAQVLSQLEYPLTFTAYIPEQRKLKQQVRELLQRYQRQRPDIRLEFIDPERRPDLARQAGVSMAGELVVKYQDRREMLNQLSEQSITDAIQRLFRRQEHWLINLTGHGERQISGTANHDLGRFGQQLEAKGFRFQGFNMAQAAAVPENTSLLILASPQVRLLKGETQRLLDYLEQGGNLLWLLEPGDPQGLEPLASALGITLLPGTIVDANGAAIGIDDPAISLVTQYPAHAATLDLQQVSLFPHAAALAIEAPSGWQATTLLQTLPQSWNETGPIQGKVRRDSALNEQAGPLTLGIALARPHPQGNGEQRVMIIGDGDFLANAYLANAGNLDLGLRLIRWLVAEQGLLQVPARIAPDQRLDLPDWLTLLLGLGHLIGLPLLLLAIGLQIWRVRNREAP